MEFKDIQQTWQQQPKTTTLPNFEPIQQKLTSLRKKQRITHIILGITGIVLLTFFFYISAYKHSGTFLGMTLLISVVLVRMMIEFRSQQKLRNINRLVSLNEFKEQLIRYYKNRKIIAFRVIPILLIIYNIGFTIMAYYFYQYLSRGFFYYVIISYVVSFIILFYFIRKQVLNELSILKTLQENGSSIAN